MTRLSVKAKVASNEFAGAAKRITELWLEREALIKSTFIKAFEANLAAFEKSVDAHRDETWTLVEFTITQDGDLRNPKGYYATVKSDLNREASIHFNADFSAFNAYLR